MWLAFNSPNTLPTLRLAEAQSAVWPIAAPVAIPVFVHDESAIS
jgi:hypothetical protein